MKKIFLLCLFAALVFDAGAQGIQRTRETLARPDAYTRARVNVYEEPDAAMTVTAADNLVKKAKIMGFRVSLFRDNSQTAGDNARSVAAQFREQYPHIPVEVTYKSPYFTVTAGNFVDKVDAIAMCGKVLPSFNKAFVVQEELSVANIVAQQKAVFDAGENAEQIAD